MNLLADAAANPSMVLLALAIGLALAFEFVNGFHDTANAVATVIYTHSLPPRIAVVWSGLWNLTGVLCSSGAVAFAIVALLPVELVLNVGSGAGFAMVFSLLVSAMIWNVGTWYLGLPASSSHTLVGAILGVGVANALISGHSWTEGVNWHEAQKVGLALLVSPIFGFVCSALLLLLLKATISNPALFTAPEKDKTPPTWIRAILILTCTGVSFGHGRNDGQKGMGLIVLILVGLMPINYALRMDAPSDEVKGIAAQAQVVQPILAKGAGAATVTATEAKTELENYTKEGAVTEKAYAAMAFQSQLIHDSLASANSFGDLSPEKRTELRKNIFLENNAITKLTKTNVLKEPADNAAVTKFGKDLTGITNFIPLWVKIAVAFALGLGTMIGWKRIVVTVGEKIGKSHLTYGQGAAAELVAAATIIAADNFGMPVSTTHVLSSGVAGTMAANGSGLQAQTLRNILLAWVLTLPVCMILGSALFAFANNILLSWLGLK